MKRGSDPLEELKDRIEAAAEVINGPKRRRFEHQGRSGQRNILQGPSFSGFNYDNPLLQEMLFSNYQMQQNFLSNMNLFNFPLSLPYNVGNINGSQNLLTNFSASNFNSPLSLNEGITDNHTWSAETREEFLSDSISGANVCDTKKHTTLSESNESDSSEAKVHGNSKRYQCNGIEPPSFLCLEEKFGSKCPPDDYCKGVTSRFQKLTREMWANFSQNQQDRKMFRQKIELWNELEIVLRKCFRATTHVFGSTLNGFGGSGSDMDICMFTTDASAKKGWDKDHVKLLADVRKAIRRECRNFISGNIELVPAKIPILKFYDQYGKIEVDLSCNNQTSVRNTNLLFCYSQIDWRVRPLVLAVKNWAKAADINEARFSTLSSYCLSLMVIHFLQVGVKEPVVPNLHELHPEVFHPDSNIFDLPFTCDIEPSYQSKNKMSLGELLYGFFEYYTKFDFTSDVGSIRAGKKLTSVECLEYAKKNKSSPGQWNAYILMEEPFDRSNAGRATCKRDKFEQILKAFENGREALKHNEPLRNILNKMDD